jgi:hypothetical protein
MLWVAPLSFSFLDVTIYELKAQERRMRNLRKQAQELGYELVERQQAA